MDDKEKLNRRDFLNRIGRVGLVVGVGAISGGLISRSLKTDYVWQLDTAKCIQCGRCATHCVLTPSAVKCMHVYDMCGYCDLCGGYFRPEAKELNTGAESQLCPTNAIERKFIEEPFFEYHINNDLCIGCGKCVKGCGAFGNGSMQLQVIQSICVNCNQCSIATHCPAEAFKRVPSNKPYLLQGFSNDKNQEG